MLEQMKSVLFWVVAAVIGLALTACSDEKVTPVAEVVSAPITVAAPAENPGWMSTFAQGTYEYSAGDANGNQLTIACIDNDNLSAIATIAGQDYSSLNHESQFNVVLDGQLYTAAFATPSRGDGDAADIFWQKLKTAKSITVVYDDKKAEIPTKGISETLPPLNAANSPCQLTW